MAPASAPYLYAYGVQTAAPEPAGYQLLIGASFSDWFFLDRAYSAGREVPLEQVDRDVGGCYSGGCIVHERVALTLTRDDVERYAAQGPFDVRIDGQRGSITLQVPRQYFAGFLAALPAGYR
jgi:hypothetical protein